MRQDLGIALKWILIIMPVGPLNSWRGSVFITDSCLAIMGSAFFMILNGSTTGLMEGNILLNSCPSNYVQTIH